MTIIERLEELVARADHKPGQWHLCGGEYGAISALPLDKQPQAPKNIREFLCGMPKDHAIFGRDFSARDVQLVVETINALPELLRLAHDGLRFRAKNHTA